MCSCLCKKRPSLCLAHTCWLMTSSRLSFRWAFSQSVARDEGSTRNGRRVLCKCQNKFVYCHCTRKCISYLVWVKHCWNEHWTLVKILVNNHFWIDIKLNNSRCDCQKCRYSCIKKKFPYFAGAGKLPYWNKPYYCYMKQGATIYFQIGIQEKVPIIGCWCRWQSLFTAKTATLDLVFPSALTVSERDLQVTYCQIVMPLRDFTYVWTELKVCYFSCVCLL